MGIANLSTRKVYESISGIRFFFQISRLLIFPDQTPGEILQITKYFPNHLDDARVTVDG